MSKQRKLVRVIQDFYQQFRRKSPSTVKEQSLWLLRSFIVTKKRPDWVNAGFVLPTVAMVSLVVVLLTVAILFRSFERSKNASNVRVNQAVLNAAKPAIDRARAKINQLIEDPLLPRSTYSDLSLTQVFESSINKYTFGDETQLKLVSEFNGTSGIQDEETLISAWKYPVDTDNDGKFDSYTLYGIYYKTPTSTRARSPVDARTQPMDEGISGTTCNTDVATSADLVGTQGWYKVGATLKRSFFVYTTTVPITDLSGIASSEQSKYEVFQGNKGFVALEYQQDRERIPLPNNAVLYEDDLEIAPGEGLNINGRIFTNGNLLTRESSRNIRFYLVSSPKSCFFTESNSKIVIAGNVIHGKITDTSNRNEPVAVDLYNSGGVTTSGNSIDSTQQTVPAGVYGSTAAYNSKAYTDRIERLVDATNSRYPNRTELPDEVQDGIANVMSLNPAMKLSEARDEQLTIYFRKRTRRVPYAEVSDGGDALGTYATTTPITGSGNSLRPIDQWVFPFDPSDGTTATNYAKIGVKTNTSNSNKIYLSATDPKVQTKADKEERIGDRILVGNGLPQLWYDSTKNQFISSVDDGQVISGKQWDDSTETRKRYSQAYQLDDLGITDRDDFWELSAAQQPQGPLDIVGGLRIVTGAGIYLPDNYNPTTRTFTNRIKTVWSDAMPMGITTTDNGLPDDNTPYLQMRATAVYHYQADSYDPDQPTNYQTPIACVSSYYDPTNEDTAKNQDGLPNVNLRDTNLNSSNRNLTGLPNVASGTGGNSNNGVVYSASSLSISDYINVLNYQAQLKYPNGRWVNEPLKDALAQRAARRPLSLSQQSAIDSALCALKILDGTIGSPTDSAIPHGTIMETAFLDARQIKAIDKPNSLNPRSYDLDVELRQPLEIRATVIDLDLLRKKARTGGEFLFPNSGVIYATRDDALADASDQNSEQISSTDFTLDPTRRPHGIMLINGSDLSRNATYEAAEKGLILASNLPVYIKGDFNVHTQEEFTDNSLKGTTDWSRKFYARKTLNPNFACRKGQPSCGLDGENWRPTTVLADAITVLSNNFRLGFRDEGDYDLNNNYDTIDINGDPVFIAFDANGDGDTNDTVSESDFGFDLNGDGDAVDTSVRETDKITTSAAAKINGFWDNNFVTSRDFNDSDYSNTASAEGSSYFNNFVTPIQRRTSFREYVMETCPKKVVTTCTPDEWVVGYDLDGDGSFSDAEKNIKANQLAQALQDEGITNLDTSKFFAGTTAEPGEDQSLPRRVAFLRHGAGLTVTKSGTAITGTDNTLVLDPADNTPVPIGIRNSGGNKVWYFPYSNTLNINGGNYEKYTSGTTDTGKPRRLSNTLWFLTNNSGAKNYSYTYPLWIHNLSSLTGTRPTEQPLLIPVLQIQLFQKNSGRSSIPLTSRSYSNDQSNIKDRTNNWLQKAVNTETNLIFAQGDTPGRPKESNGGLENFIRYLEDWENKRHNALGAFIQYKRSSYATSPWSMLTTLYNGDSGGYSTSATGTAFGFPQGYRTAVNKGPETSGKNLGRTPFYIPPLRFWGYDVALLTQLPDLFSQRFTTPATNDPNEFYREVGRDDPWVKTLLCAAKKDTVGYGDATNHGTGYKYALPQNQRSSCP